MYILSMARQVYLYSTFQQQVHSLQGNNFTKRHKKKAKRQGIKETQDAYK